MGRENNGTSGVCDSIFVVGVGAGGLCMDGATISIITRQLR